MCKFLLMFSTSQKSWCFISIPVKSNKNTMPLTFVFSSRMSIWRMPIWALIKCRLSVVSGSKWAAGKIITTVMSELTHYCDVIMSATASQITGVSFVYSVVCSDADQRKQSFVSLAFVREIHRWPVNSPHKGPVTRKMFHLMTSLWIYPGYFRKPRWLSMVLPEISSVTFIGIWCGCLGEFSAAKRYILFFISAISWLLLDNRRVATMYLCL